MVRQRPTIRLNHGFDRWVHDLAKVGVRGFESLRPLQDSTDFTTVGRCTQGNIWGNSVSANVYSVGRYSGYISKFADSIALVIRKMRLQPFQPVAASCVSAYQIHRSLGISYKSSWFMMHRLREALRTGGLTPNSDTPYSWLGLDLRTQPFVLTVPEVEKKRYYSIQFTDAYTFNIDYAGTRATGNDAASFLVVGPGWKGETPKGIKKVIRSETDILMPIYRVQLFDPGDIDNVKKVQSGFKVQPLSSFLGTPAPKAAPAIDFIKPLTPETQKTSLEFFNIVNFVLRYCPTDPTEVELMKRFAKIGVGAGKTFDPSKLSPEMTKAFEDGRADAWAGFAGVVKQFEEGKVSSGDLIGTRKYLKNNYLYRMTAAVLGIYGNSKEDALYLLYNDDQANEKLSGASKYSVRFAPDQLPPVNAFWSLTMYRMPESLLVAKWIQPPLKRVT
jgi:hypothetical protein